MRTAQVSDGEVSRSGESGATAKEASQLAGGVVGLLAVSVGLLQSLSGQGGGRRRGELAGVGDGNVAGAPPLELRRSTDETHLASGLASSVAVTIRLRPALL